MVFSVLCQLQGGCMGCCGNNFGTVKQIKEAIWKNTAEFTSLEPVSDAEFKRFRDRCYISDLRHGVCRNLIDDGKLGCPLHPSNHDGQDLRENHCDISYLCKTAKEFALWGKVKQDKFIVFISKKKLDNINYSLQMDKSSLLEEFES
ncbi:hypothetical protein HOI26_03460 [Candidatus Woesearchaeota archaeon]|jgi:hypothetical protein|nr:hypothetical protein [Candidatus Woesearchaeota archaeon]MBT5740133.1 hypothetical protein [Candidatus Woesearchaeota archaeon]